VGEAVVIALAMIGFFNRQYLLDRYNLARVVRVQVLAPQAEGSLRPGDSFKECANGCPEMVVVPAGAFTMGSPISELGRQDNEGPQHRVVIAAPFAVSKFEVRFADWDACSAYGYCDPRISDNGWGRGWHPVINVSWNDAQIYVQWLSKITGKPYRLLSEAEYEYATRAGTTTAYPWGDDIKLNGQVMANCNDCGSRWDMMQTAPVGSFPPNRFGLYDMVGNVWEWVEDCYHANFQGAPTDGSAWIAVGCENRTARGGSWHSTRDSVRSASRSEAATTTTTLGAVHQPTSGDRFTNTGFRIARTITAP
jgi:formylglycine-generating enzyme required for sulfatase activity